jgi:hypothetical protein
MMSLNTGTWFRRHLFLFTALSLGFARPIFLCSGLFECVHGEVFGFTLVELLKIMICNPTQRTEIPVEETTAVKTRVSFCRLIEVIFS